MIYMIYDMIYDMIWYMIWYIWYTIWYDIWYIYDIQVELLEFMYNFSDLIIAGLREQQTAH